MAASPPNRVPAWLSELRRALGPAVVEDPDILEGFARDWTSRFRGAPRAVVRPRDIHETAAVMRLSAHHGFAVVPQGGNTGLVGATMAPEGSVIVNLQRLDRIEEGDGPRSIVAGAGATVAAVQEAASRRGLVFGLDMGSRDSATVGGALATNAGGLFAWHWGRMRRQVTALEAVLADGTVLSTIGTGESVGTGIDTVGPLCGSEGTLAVVTAARILLHHPLGPTLVVLAGFERLADLLGFLSQSPPLIGAEIFRRQELEVVLRHTSHSPPMPSCAWYALVEIEEDKARDLQPPGEAVTGRDLWLFRDRITESLASLGVVHKFDVVVPSRRLEELVSDLSDRLRPQRLFVFGHVLMDDFHLNVAPPHPGGAVPEGIDELVYASVEGIGGEVAGEHGMGRAKGERVRLSLPPSHRRLLDGLKKAFDPEGRLNPGAGAARV